jgi:Tfp pilus assembly protein PilV
MTRPSWPRNERGTTLIDTLIGIAVFSILLKGMLAASMSAGRTMRASQAYQAAAIAAESTMDSLKARGWTAIAGASGSYTVKGHAVTWAVTGTNPRVIRLVITRQTTPSVKADTFVTYLAQ